MASAYLIVNADDFGYNEGVNLAIAACHRAGIVTSASLMAIGKAAQHAAALATELPSLSVGLHWVGDRPGVAVIDLADAKAIAKELARQLALFEGLLGRPPSHLDSHHHLHLDPRAMDVFLEAAEQLGIPVRGHGPVRFVGDFYGHADDGQSDLGRVGFAALERILRLEAAQGGPSSSAATPATRRHRCARPTPSSAKPSCAR
jgi:chitin disaccharide deacetylase